MQFSPGLGLGEPEATQPILTSANGTSLTCELRERRPGSSRKRTLVHRPPELGAARIRTTTAARNGRQVSSDVEDIAHLPRRTAQLKVDFVRNSSELAGRTMLQEIFRDTIRVRQRIALEQNYVKREAYRM